MSELDILSLLRRLIRNLKRDHHETSPIPVGVCGGRLQSVVCESIEIYENRITIELVVTNCDLDIVTLT